MADTNEFKPRPCHHCGAAHGHFTDCLHKYERAIATAPDLGGLWALCNYFSRMKATPPADAAQKIASAMRSGDTQRADAAMREATGGRLGIKAADAAVPDDVAKDALSRIAALAHCGGLAKLSDSDVVLMTRKITLPWCDNSGTLRDLKNRVDAAILAAKEKGNDPA